MIFFKIAAFRFLYLGALLPGRHTALYEDLGSCVENGWNVGPEVIHAFQPFSGLYLQEGWEQLSGGKKHSPFSCRIDAGTVYQYKETFELHYISGTLDVFHGIQCSDPRALTFGEKGKRYLGSERYYPITFSKIEAQYSIAGIPSGTLISEVKGNSDEYRRTKLGMVFSKIHNDYILLNRLECNKCRRRGIHSIYTNVEGDFGYLLTLSNRVFRIEAGDPFPNNLCDLENTIRDNISFK